jgi:hypothetical protein
MMNDRLTDSEAETSAPQCKEVGAVAFHSKRLGNSSWLEIYELNALAVGSVRLQSSKGIRQTVTHSRTLALTASGNALMIPSTKELRSVLKMRMSLR